MFLLAHLSDPHLRTPPRPPWSEFLNKRAIGYANWWRKRRRSQRGEVLARITADLKAHAPNHIAVTGDLVNVSLSTEYAPARQWLESLGSPRNVTLVPGNHDAYVRAAAEYPHYHWSDYMRADEALDAAFPFLRRRGPLAIIGLSSAVPTGPFMATGRLGKEQIGRLGPMLDRCRGDRLFRVLMVHHPPLAPARRHLKRLLDSGALRSVLARHGAEIVIHGHDHIHSRVAIEGPRGPIPVLGVPSASQRPDGRDHPAGYSLYRIEGDADRWRCEIIARSLARDGVTVVETARTSLF
jgi:3',5'-cyclic AMP phosphodiesterase CpdA